MAANADIAVTNIFGSSLVQVTSQVFRRCRTKVIFGRVDIDLRNAGLAADVAKVNIMAALGSVTIRVPEDWAVNARTMTLLGTVTSKRIEPASPTGEVTLSGAILLGGVVVTS